MNTLGLIGCGYWGPNLLRILHKEPDCRVKWICDFDEEKLIRMKKRYPDVMTTQRAEDVIGDPETKAIFIATPVSSHFPLARNGLLKGKDVFVEKPFTASSDEAESLIDLAQKNNRILMVGHVFQYSPPVVKIRELIGKGELGNICFVTSSRVNLGIHRKDVSVLWDLASHDLSMILYWIEENPIKVSAVGRGYIIKDLPDVAFLNLTYDSGIIANIEVSWLAPTKLRRTTIVGSKKMLIYDDTQNIEKIKIYDKGVEFNNPEDFGEFQLSYRTGEIVSPILNNAEPLQVELRHFLDCVEGRKNPMTDGLCGLRVVKILEMAEISLRNGGTQLERE
jgi:predicted dehydrogenase